MILTFFLSAVMNLSNIDSVKTRSITVDALKLEMSAGKSYYLTNNGLKLLSVNDSSSLTDIGLIFTIRNNDSIGYYIDELLPLFIHLEIEMVDRYGKVVTWNWSEWSDDLSCLSSSLVFIYDFNKNSNPVGKQIVDIFELESIKKQSLFLNKGSGRGSEYQIKEFKNKSICYLRPGEKYSWFFCLNYFLTKGLKFHVRLNQNYQLNADINDMSLRINAKMPEYIEDYKRFDGTIQSDWIEFGPYE